MDTKTLVVGQKARMQSGNSFVEVTVTGITEKGIQVEPVLLDQNERPWMMIFDKKGKLPTPFSGTGEWIGFGYYEWFDGFAGFTGWFQDDPRSNTPHGPWELTDSGS